MEGVEQKLEITAPNNINLFSKARPNQACVHATRPCCSGYGGVNARVPEAFCADGRHESG
jgi:hypothetical protein